MTGNTNTNTYLISETMSQTPFLNLLLKDHTPVAIYLVNGVKLLGELVAFDSHVLFIRADRYHVQDSNGINASDSLQMIYIHAISTIQPLAPLDLPEGLELSTEDQPVAADASDNEFLYSEH